MIRAIRLYLQARSYSTTHYHRRNNINQISLASVQELDFEVYSAWRSSGDDGRQLYRTAQTKRSNTKDASWALVRWTLTCLPRSLANISLLPCTCITLLQYDQAYDKNQRSSIGLASFRRIAQLQWGKVLHFVRFSWTEKPGGKATTLEVAVVQPWEVVPWLDGINPADFDEPPWRLTKEKSQLQVMEVRALRHVAGRVPIDGSDKWVVFETSLGLLVPDMV